ncbi:3-oxoacyl-(acyl-carrier-protein) synthase/acyl carrier protein [Clostridium saccharoperbutylacetonicum]|uniref:Mycosubtilin synthase subunit A n=1 Tax=Clostridium saccharoperbutylacetonicum N1-4(HMT) TaxID=931276 RepID=M1MCT5_9CLOT|nr:condensation domain-containing protein [Clostridium saccharoperbutylacetonicum]AGF54208.1 mycosubtilin synthase subunit A [Clostridium saccharoperbutylacetonicum N1-4(HMT)]NRT59278.1 3-oxoacyl-(acyl-carrier-protein) synthase/acyl carrier protein [Clostridium saccharoperbutylacetonicum]NSB28468.1 3-oxoacyl-(acyl-carrier-protein) synthase/acyl carrier protein [Clostridium saccharoperbutylacetonicum]NSB41957.1 3-oxoacyl-(acyl-carrier-protein) synthase/acyl carrier protein [Clostridium saccharop
MRKFEKVAIVGISGKFPGAESIDDLDRIYSNKIDCIKPFSERRKELLKLDKTKKYFDVAYLDGVEYFDYDFFNISRQEAACMDPQQKMLLELACEAIEDAGYSLKSARGSKTSIILGAHNSHFFDDYLEESSGFAAIGNFLDTLAGRIAYCLDLHGQASIVETACSSSLYAVYEACLRLNAGEADMALAGGITLEFRAKYDDFAEQDVLGIISPRARCKTFDEEADGINLGEGAGLVLLKRYEDAIRDKDSIYAVIRSVSSNQDGARSNSLAAPSSAAQCEVMIDAWEKADLNPEDIGYFEAHGTGTKIGDPIEVLGITEAFRKYTDKKQFCPIGSLKTNISHLGSAAGISSVLKGVLSLKNNKKYPLCNLEKINSLIDFNNSPVYPITEVERWDENKPKIMAMSGLGVSGTNVHLVLEDNKLKFDKADDESEYFVTISGKTSDIIDDYKEILKESTENYSLGDICYTLNAGRNDYEFRTSAKVKNKKEFLDFLSTKTAVSQIEENKLLFLISGDNVFSEQEVKILKEKYPVFKKVYEELYNEMSIKNEKILKVLCYVAMYQQLIEWGITPDKIIGTGLGNIVVDYVTNNIALSDLEIEINKAEYNEFNQIAFENYIESLNKSEKNSLVLVELGKSGKMTDCLKEKNNHKSLKIFNMYNSIDTSMLDTLSSLYDIGINIDWNKYYSAKGNVKVHIATYPFRKTLAWPKSIISSIQQKKNGIEVDTTLELKEFLRNLWCKELDIEEINDDDDFFDLGANSLMTMNIDSIIYKRTGVKLDFDDFYTYATINDLEKYLKSKCKFNNSTNQAENSISNEIIRIERKDLMKVSYNQRRMLYTLETVENSSLYNMPFVFKIEGNLDKQSFINSLKQVVRRHEIFHTIYEKKDGEYYQKILNEYTFEPEFEDRRGIFTEDILENLRNCINHKFDLFSEIPVYSKVIQASDNEYLWFINMHHIVADGSSLAVFNKDLALCYDQYTKGNTDYELPELDIQYADFSEWEHNFINSEKSKKQLEFWKTELHNVKGILNFPLDKERPSIQTFNGSKIDFRLDEELSAMCKEYCKDNNVSLYMLLETIYAIELYRYSNDNDVCIGSPMSNRRNESLRDIIGFIANTIVIRNKINPDESFKETLLRNKENISTIYSNIELPYEEIITNIKFERNISYSPLIQYMFVLQNFNGIDFEFCDLKMKYIELNTLSSMFEMTMMLYENKNTISGMLEYNTDLFNQSTINKFINTYKFMIKYILNNDEVTLDNILLSEEIDSNYIDTRDKREDFSF